MSKPIARVVFSALIALALVVGIYTSVLGASASVGTKSAQGYISADASLNLRQAQDSAQKSDSFEVQPDASNQSGHDCQNDINPEDY
jgi:hypothetical protein